MLYLSVKKLLLLASVLFVVSCSNAQEKITNQRYKELRIGLNYGKAKQSIYPFNNWNYIYENSYFKAQINYLWKQKNNFRFEVNIEPSIYFSKHQLLRWDYIFPDQYGPNFQELRDLYTQTRSFNEYAINFGLITRYELSSNLSSYIILSIGPAYGSKSTERLKKGFTFSDIAGLGIYYNYKKFILDMRLTIRHISNLNISFPNKGHNSVGLETGVSFIL